MISEESLKKLCLTKKSSLREAMQIIEDYSAPCVLIISDIFELQGVITDGDIRRSILKKNNLDLAVTDFMNKSPLSLPYKSGREEAIQLMKEKDLEFIPILKDKKIISLITLKEVSKLSKFKDITVVIMAGGLGTRLNELTKSRPKPLMLVKEKPILEHIIINLKNQGFNNFVISINHLSEKIKDYFNSVDNLGVNIKYIEEKQKMGTAGSLSLLKKNDYKDNLIVMNGDLMTNFDFRFLVEEFDKNTPKGIMCITPYQHKVPYGVINVKNKNIISIEEKPSLNFYINAGIYMLSRDMIENIKKETIDMTELFEAEVKNNSNMKTYEIQDYWIDIANKSDLFKANEDANEKEI